MINKFKKLSWLIALLISIGAPQVATASGIFGPNYNPNNVDIKGGTIDSVGITSATFNAGAIGASSINSTTVGATSPQTGAFTTISASGAVTSTRACATNYIRVSPNICAVNVTPNPTALVRDACTPIADVDSNSVAYDLVFYSSPRAGNSVLARWVIINIYSDSGCTALLYKPVITQRTFEYVAQTVGTSLSAGSDYPTVAKNGNAIIYVKFGDDAGNSAIANYSIRAYRD